MNPKQLPKHQTFWEVTLPYRSEELNSLKSRRDLGHWGESFVSQYLENQGYTLLIRNEKTPHAEVDLIMAKLSPWYWRILNLWFKPRLLWIHSLYLVEVKTMNKVSPKPISKQQLNRLKRSAIEIYKKCKVPVFTGMIQVKIQKSEVHLAHYPLFQEGSNPNS